MGSTPARSRKKHGAPAEVRATADFTGAFGAFRFIERIERDNGPSELHRAFWTGAPSGDERSCLIKRLRPELADSPAFQHMFAVETRTMTALDHPNIVRVYSHGQIDGLPYLALEPLDGWSLQHLLASLKRGGQKLPIEVAAFIAREVASALAHAHGARDASGQLLGIIHRDVRPANVMLLRTGAVKLIDFGVPRVASFVSQNLNVNTAPGKPSYLSPEHLAGSALDGRADLFSLGAVLWELLLGQPLFPPGSPEELTARLERHPIARPAGVRAQVPAALDALVMRLLERPLATRAQSAAEVARELSAFVPVELDASRAISSMVRSGLGPGPGVPVSMPGVQRSLSRLLPPIRALLARGAKLTGSHKASASSKEPRRPTAVVAVDAVLGLRAKLFRGRATRTPTSEVTPQPPPPEAALLPAPVLPPPPEGRLRAVSAYLSGPKGRLLAVQAVAVAVIAFTGGAMWSGPRPPSVAISTATAAPEPVVSSVAGVVIEPLGPRSEATPPAATPAAPSPTPAASPATPVAKRRSALPARKKLHKRLRARRR